MILEMINIEKSYKETNFILKDINLQLYRNEIVGIVGENGAGKSTILKLIAGLIEYDKGKIIFNGELTSKLNGKKNRNMRKKISYIFQDSNLLKNKSVYYHFTLPFKLSRKKIDDQMIDEMLKFMNLTQYKHSKCENLSGGQSQKVAIGVSLLSNAEIILCDEISSALDKLAEEEIFNLLLEVRNKYNSSIVIISHNMSIIKKYCEKVYFLADNSIYDTISPNQGTFKNSDKNFYKYVKGYLLDD